MRKVSAAVLVLLAVPAFAQPAPGKFFDTVDSNRDGAMSKAEWAASGRAPQGFAMMDANKDGKVSRAEADSFMAKMMGGPPPKAK